MTTELDGSSTEPKVKNSEELNIGLTKAQPLAVPMPTLTKEIVLPASSEAVTQPAPPMRLSQERKNVLTTLGLQLYLIVLMVATTFISLKVHHIGWPFPTIEEIAVYNFIGVTSANPQPSAAAVISEVLVWSFLGVAARQIYYLYRNLVRNKDNRIDALQLLSKMIGEAAMGVAISAAVVAFFISTSLTIAQVELTLQNANLMSIVAISFVLGFYHEDTQRLLGSFHRGLSGRREEGDDSKKDKEDSD